MRFATAYSRVVRYGAHESWANLRDQMETTPAIRWGTHPDHSIRQVAADAYQEATGDEEGASHLRNPTQHVVFDGDRVRKGRFTLDHVEAAHAAVSDHLRRMTEGGYLANHGFGWATNDESDPHVQFDTEDDLNSDTMHISRLPRELADHLDRRSSDNFGEWADGGNVPDYLWHRLDRLLDDLRNAPVEEPVPNS